jgi:hypothetical protein
MEMAQFGPEQIALFQQAKLAEQQQAIQQQLVLMEAQAAIKAAAGPRPDGMEVCHEDDVKANNSLSNLSYGTRQKNVRDAYRNGRLPVGEDRTDVVLTEDLVERILVRIGTAESQCALGRELGVSQGAISKVVHGINWKHVSGRLGYTFSRSGPLRRPAGPSGDEMGHETSYRSNVGDMALLLCGLYFFTSPQEAGHDPGDRLRRSG